MSVPPENPLVRAALIGTVLQLLMVAFGHYSPAVAQLFPVIGTGLGGVSGVLAGLWSPEQRSGSAAGRGAIAGGAGALIGTVVSHVLGDVPLSVLAIGTGASGAAGAIGGILGRMLGSRRSG